MSLLLLLPLPLLLLSTSFVFAFSFAFRCCFGVTFLFLPWFSRIGCVCVCVCVGVGVVLAVWCTLWVSLHSSASWTRRAAIEWLPAFTLLSK